MNPRDLILAASFTREKKPVSVPEWPGTDGTLFMRSLNALEYEQYVTIVRRPADASRCSAAEVAVLVLVDEGGTLLFKPEDATALALKDPEPLETVLAAFSNWRYEQSEARKKSSGQKTGESGTT